MNISLRLKQVFAALPALYNVQPTSDYQSLISHSASELDAKAWERTGRGLRDAIHVFEVRNPDVRRHINHSA